MTWQIQSLSNSDGVTIYLGPNAKWYVRRPVIEMHIAWADPTYAMQWGKYLIEREGFSSPNAAAKWVDENPYHPMETTSLPPDTRGVASQLSA